MFQMIRSATGGIHLYLMAALILAIVGLSVALKISHSEVAIKQGTIETLTAQKQTLQRDLTNAAKQLLIAEQDKHRLRQQIEIVSTLNIESQRRENKIENQLREQHQLIAKLRTSKNDTVNQWANTAVPDDAWRLLHNHANCTNNDTDQNQNCVRSQKHDRPLSTAES